MSDSGRRGLVERAEDRLVNRVGLSLLTVGATALVVAVVLLGGSWSTRATAAAVAGVIAGGELLFALGLSICLPRWLDDGPRAARVVARLTQAAGGVGLLVTVGAAIRARGEYLLPVSLFATVSVAALVLVPRFMRRSTPAGGPVSVSEPSSSPIELPADAAEDAPGPPTAGSGIGGAELAAGLGAALLAVALGLLFAARSEKHTLAGFLVLAAAAGLLGVGLPEVVSTRFADDARRARRMGSVLLGLAVVVLAIAAAGVALNRTPYAVTAAFPALVVVLMVELGRRLRTGRLSVPAQPGDERSPSA